MKPFENFVGKGENAGSVLSQFKFIILAAFTSLSSNPFTLDKSKILLFCKELTLSQTTNFKMLSNSKRLQMTILGLLKMAESSPEV